MAKFLLYSELGHTELLHLFMNNVCVFALSKRRIKNETHKHIYHKFIINIQN